MLPFRAVIAATTRRFSSVSKPTAPYDNHNKAVETISSNVRQFYERKEKFRIYHGSTNSTRPPSTKGNNILDTSALSNVLEVNTERRTALVEPNVPMDRLVEQTLRHGLVPPVVMEFPGITVGGGYAGTSGESSSFKHGFFDQTMNYVEMVLANGDVVKCSNTEKPDLFRGAAGAVGSLGVVTLVELQLRKATKYVETTYHPVSSAADAIQKIQHATVNPELDYVDGILFSKHQGAMITGRMTDDLQQNIRVQRFSGAKDPWFYLHVQEQIAKTSVPVTEAIPLAEYLFRYDRGGFWVGASVFDKFRIPFNRFTRWFLDDFLHTRMMYTGLHASGLSEKYIVQDLALPYPAAESFVEFADDAFGIYPLWLCPLRQSPLPTMHPHYNDPGAEGSTMNQMLNIGLWGWGPTRLEEFVKANRKLEDKVRELGGMKWLYAHTYYTEDEFWKMYDRKWYDDLRQKYDATSLPSVYDKVKVDVAARSPATKKGFRAALVNTLPFSGLYGLKKAIESKSYLEARASSWKSI